MVMTENRSISDIVGGTITSVEAYNIGEDGAEIGSITVERDGRTFDVSFQVIERFSNRYDGGSAYHANYVSVYEDQ